MNRKNYTNISNNFQSAGVYNPAIPPQQQQQLRQTRSSAPVTPQVEMTSTVVAPTTSNNIEITPQQELPTSVWNPDFAEKTATPPSARISISEEELAKLKKINFKKKVSGKEKRLKQNKKLFRMLTPRNAIAALNELTAGQPLGETKINPLDGNKFEAEVILGNVKYKGTGTSKMNAKNAASEKALRDFVLNKLKQAKQQEDKEKDEDVPMEDDTDSAQDTAVSEIPMLQLASFALHKLFAEWEAEGFEIPKLTDNVPPPPSATAMNTDPPAAPKPPKLKNELPKNSESMHPVMLLSVMRPVTTYNDLGSQGQTPNIMHTVGTTIDGQSFIGQGRSKKEARKRVATTILQKLFDWQGSCC